MGNLPLDLPAVFPPRRLLLQSAFASSSLNGVTCGGLRLGLACGLFLRPSAYVLSYIKIFWNSNIPPGGGKGCKTDLFPSLLIHLRGARLLNTRAPPFDARTPSLDTFGPSLI